MIPYLICFIITPLFTYLAETSFKEKSKNKAVFYSLIAILIPSIIAGIRDLSVGVDAEIYVAPVLKGIGNMSLLSAFKTYSLEKGYILLVYLVSYITQNPNMLLFLIHLIITVCIYLTAYKCRNKISMTIFMTVYILFMYTKTLNLIRQSLGTAIFIYSLTYLFNKKYLKTSIFFAIALTFHSSVIFLGIIYILFFINNLRIKYNIKILIFILLIVITFVFAINMQSIIKFLTFELKILPDTYYSYFSNIIVGNNNYVDFIIKTILMIIASIIVINDKNKENLSINITLLECITLGLIFTVAMFYIGQLGEIYRISFSFVLIGTIYIFSNIFNILKDDLFNKLSSYGIIVAILLLQWIIYYVINGEASLYPYIFMK